MKRATRLSQYILLIDKLKSMMMYRFIIVLTQHMSLQVRLFGKRLITVSALHDSQCYNKIFSKGTFLKGLLSPRSNPSPLIVDPSASKSPCP